MKEGKQFPEWFVTVVALNQAALYHFATFYVLPIITLLGEFRFAYETYHTRMLFVKRYVRTLAYSILAYAYISSSHDGDIYDTIR